VPRLRSSEWLLLAYFAYVALVSPFFISPWKPLIVAMAVAALLITLARKESWIRDLVPLPLTLAAFEEMDWFTPAVRDHHLEQAWIVWDRMLFDHYGLRAIIESAGPLLPFFLELCYALVYAAAPIALWALVANGRRDRVNRFWLSYLAGTLGAYLRVLRDGDGKGAQARLPDRVREHGPARGAGARRERDCGRRELPVVK